MSIITIIAAADEKYAMYFCVMATSVLKHAEPNDHYIFKLLNNGFLPETMDKIQKLAADGTCTVDFVDISGFDFSHIPTLSHLSAMTNARLKITSLFPELQRAIYLDCDVVVNKNLNELWNYNLGNNPAGACLDFGATEEELRKIGFSLNNYFNAGVLLLDLDILRQMDFEQKVVDTLTCNKLLRHDQDILNAVFQGKWTSLPLEWNIQPELYHKLLKQYSRRNQKEFMTALRHPGIIHYGGRKPTSYRFRGKYRKEFWDCLKLTEYRNFEMTDVSFRNWARRCLPNGMQLAYCKGRDWLLAMVNRSK